MHLTPITLLGSVAPVLFVYAYAMVSLGKWTPGMLRFHALNLVGALLVLLSLSEQWNLAICLLEGAWASISVYGMAKALKVKRA